MGRLPRRAGARRRLRTSTVKEWVHGTYAHYAKAYVDVEDQAQTSSFDAYKLLAQKGIAALDALQSREVPFFIRVAPDGASFRVERDVPERLTFSADMSQPSVTMRRERGS